MARCDHSGKIRLYRRGPRPDSKFLPWGWACDKCGYTMGGPNGEAL